LAALLIAGSLVAQTGREERMGWVRNDKFGMFIHWGLYAIPAGEWKGQQVPGIAEWIMKRVKAPVPEYEQLAKQFNPTHFDAEEWVRVAKSGGARFLVITAKHHDGFALWHSKVSKYNVYDATPFHRDVIGEMVAACHRNGLPIGLYYSQTQDWHEPNGDGNDWDFNESKKDFDKYLHEKAIPQVRELLTEYGPVASIWFDTPKRITAVQSKELADLVHLLQPACLVNARVGNDMGDFRGMGDAEIPINVVDYDFDSVVSLNDTWGFKKNDTNWKTPATIVRQLADIVSKRGFYMLNVGPTADGVIPQPAVERFKAVGDWLRVNGEAIFGSKPSPYPYEFEWGSVTSKPGRLYLQISQWPANGEFTLYGLSNKVEKAYALASRGTEIPFFQREINGRHELRLKGPVRAPDPSLSVIALELSGAPEVEKGLVQQPDGKVTLACPFAKVEGPPLTFESRGAAKDWMRTSDTLSWDFKTYRLGAYSVVAITSEKADAGDWAKSLWSGDHQVKISVAGQSVEGPIKREGEIVDSRTPNFRDVRTVIGKINLAAAGDQHLTVQALKINTERKLGFRLREVQLIPDPWVVPTAYWLDPDRSEPPALHYRSFPSKLAGSDVSYLLYLPPDYETAAQRRYPVVYWLHPLRGVPRAGAKFVSQLDDAIRRGKAPAMIVVLVNGMRDSFYCDSKDGKRPVESVIIKELIPHVDRAYRTIAKREARSVEGYSMGGFGTAHLGFKYPEVFGMVGIMAGALVDFDDEISRQDPVGIAQNVWGDDKAYFEANDPRELVRKNADAIRDKTAVRIAIGDQDSLLARDKSFHELLTELKIGHEFIVVPGVAHNTPVFYATLGDRAFEWYSKALTARGVE
jgi:alpha-L-fucosidase